MKRTCILLVFALILATCGITSAAVVTNNISFSGILTDSGSNPVSGTFTVTFRLYTASSGGSAIATDTHTVTAAATGQFSTTLNFPAGKYNGQGLWVSIQRGSDPEKTSRTALRPVPYAMSLRPGAVMTGDAGSGSLLNLRKTGSGKVLDVLSTGIAAYGVYVNATGPFSDGIFVQTSGEPDFAIETLSSGNTSSGILSTVKGNASTGISAVAKGNYSEGIRSSVDGRYGTGVRVETTNADSAGINLTVQGARSNGIVLNYSGTSGKAISAIVPLGKTTGLWVQMYGPMSTGIFVVARDGVSTGISASALGNGSNAGTFSTTGTVSDGITVTTHGKNSNGVRARTLNDYSPGLNISTEGNFSNGITAVTSGSYSTAVRGIADGFLGYGVWGSSNQSYGLYGYSKQNYAIFAQSSQKSAIYADTGRTDGKYGLYTPDYIYAKGSQYPAVDVAEYFPAANSAAPGTVMVIGPEGTLVPSSTAYDTRVAGIVSTDPAVSLGAKDTGNPGEVPLAVAGRVPCLVDAGTGAIRPGDVLTTSSRSGYAMKAEPVNIAGVQIYRPGTMLGKALGTIESGTGTIEVLVSLQ